LNKQIDAISNVDGAERIIERKYHFAGTGRMLFDFRNNHGEAGANMQIYIMGDMIL